MPRSRISICICQDSNPTQTLGCISLGEFRNINTNWNTFLEFSQFVYSICLQSYRVTRLNYNRTESKPTAPVRMLGRTWLKGQPGRPGRQPNSLTPLYGSSARNNLPQTSAKAIRPRVQDGPTGYDIGGLRAHGRTLSTTTTIQMPLVDRRGIEPKACAEARSVVTNHP